MVSDRVSTKTGERDKRPRHACITHEETLAYERKAQRTTDSTCKVRYWVELSKAFEDARTAAVQRQTQVREGHISKRTHPDFMENSPGELAKRDARFLAESAATRPMLRGREWASLTWGVMFFALSSTNVPRTWEQSGASLVKRRNLVASALRLT